MKTSLAISAYHARIGRRGGSKTSPAKRAAARSAALKRWGHDPVAAIPVDALTDGRWYQGKGRNADIGLWDARTACFWVTSISERVDPMRFPEPGDRMVRLKRERHADENGTFRPSREIV